MQIPELSKQSKCIVECVKMLEIRLLGSVRRLILVFAPILRFFPKSLLVSPAKQAPSRFYLS